MMMVGKISFKTQSFPPCSKTKLTISPVVPTSSFGFWQR